jgi:hypothetical protein
MASAPIPAIDLYDGPLFRTLRRAVALSCEPVDVWILSAKHGLVPASELLSPYDEQLNVARASELTTRVREQWTHGPGRAHWNSMLVAVGAVYEQALTQIWPMLSPTIAVQISRGTIGRRASTLRRWLGVRDTDATQSGTKLTSLVPAISADDVLDIATRVQTQRVHDELQGWFVSVGEVRVPVKRLVSAVTGVPVSRFRTADAIRFLRNVGIQVDHHI